MDRTTAFIDALENWDKETTEKISTLKDLIFMIGFKIGFNAEFNDSDEENLKQFKNYIDGLSKTNNIFIDFIINGLIMEVDNYLSGFLDRLGQSIINNEKLLEQAEKEEKMSTDFIINQIEKMKDFEYQLKAENQIDTWNKIKAEYFSLSNLRKWQNEETLKVVK